MTVVCYMQVMGMTTAIGVLEGTDSRYFAIALVFSLVVSVAQRQQLPCFPPAFVLPRWHCASWGRRGGLSRSGRASQTCNLLRRACFMLEGTE